LNKGIKGGPKPENLWSDEERLAFEMMETNHIHDVDDEGKPYEFVEAKLPWKVGHDTRLRNNFEAVKRRQDATLSKAALAKKGIKIEQVVEIFQSYEKKGYIKEVPKEEHGQGWYLPFFCVVNLEKKSTPIRPVFDAKAQFGKVSLNNQIMDTPNMLNDTWPTLLHLRQYKFAMTGDISEMFLRIRLHEDDQKYHRFVLQGKVYQWTRILFGNKSSPNISQKALKKICKKYENIYPVAVQCIRAWCYMDDAVSSMQSELGLAELATQLPALLQKADMKITKFYTNSEKVLKVLPKELVAKEIQQFSDKDTIFESNKVLGMVWDASTDELKFNSKYKSVEEWLKKFDIQQWTKRTVLKSTASTYDPLGLIAPLTVHARVVIQQLWTLELDWDTPIPQENTEKWYDSLENLVNIHEIKLPRWIGCHSNDDKELHIFCDASELVYCCSAYMRVNSVGGLSSGIICAKARVSPIKSETISRLELIACVLGVRMARAINLVFDVPPNKTHFWTDSRNALCWINTPTNKLKVYVQNRVGEIQRSTETAQWHHVPTDMNPADVATRFITSDELKENSLWWKGPEFLTTNAPYPKFSPSGIPKEVEIEMKTEDVTYVSVDESRNVIEELVERHSTGRLSNGYEKVVGTLIQIIKFKNKLMRRSTNLADCRKEAIEVLIRKSQHRTFRKEIRKLKENKILSAKIPVSRTNPFVDNDGILRSSSRLGNLVNYRTANPIVLHISCPIARMIVEDAHVKYLHTVSTNAMFTSLSKRYKIMGMGKYVRWLKKNCAVCQRHVAQPRSQIMGDLKKELTEERPFAETGIDYAGPFSVKVGRGKVRKQMYVLILTCLTTRAVHFEVCEDQKTSSVLNALTRFADVRGAPTIIRSDNQTSFVAARKELLQLVTEDEAEAIQENLQRKFDKSVTWEFIPPRAPHFGGSWEIMVKAMKRAVRVITDGTDVNEDQFRTAVSQAASLLNSRPLSREFLDEKEIIITPNSFLVGQFSTNLSGQDAEPKLSKLGAKYKEVLKIGQKVWRQFQKEILPELAPRAKWFKTFPNPKPGDVVLVIEEGTPRGQWKMAVIEELKLSSDGKARSATIRMNGKLFDRPIINLFPLFDRDFKYQWDSFVYYVLGHRE